MSEKEQLNSEDMEEEEDDENEIYDEQDKLFIEKIKNKQTGGLSKSILSSFVIQENKKIGIVTAAASVFASTMGAGCLTLPNVQKSFGYAFAFLLLFVNYITSSIGGYMVLKCKDLSKKKDLGEIAVHCFGKTGEVISKTILFLFCIGMSISYLVVFATVIQEIIGKDGDNFFYKKYIYYLFLTIILCPFAFAKTAERLKFVSYLNLFACVVFFFISIYAPTQDTNQGNTSFGIPSDFTIAEGLGAIGCVSVSYAFNFIVLDIFKQLKNKSNKKMTGAIIIGNTGVGGVYVVTATLAYLAFGSYIKPNVLLNFKKDEIHPFPFFLLYIAYGALTISGMYVLFFGGRNFFLDLLWDAIKVCKKNKDEDLLDKDTSITSEGVKKTKDKNLYPMSFFFIVTAILYGIVVFLGMILKDLKLIASVIGAVCGNGMTYMLPCSYYIYLGYTHDKKDSIWILSIVLFCFGLVSCMATLIGDGMGS